MKIYIAGPYSSSPQVNTIRAIDMAEKVAQMGHFPFIPHLTHFWEKQHHHEYEFWLRQDLEWLSCCDALLRLPGKSSGADGEEKWAKENGLIIFHSLVEIETCTSMSRI